jgi:hypothetical protein
MARSTQRFLPKAPFRMGMMCSGILCMAIASTGCKNRSVNTRTEETPRGFVSVASIRWDRLPEQRELHELLETNGITMDIWGTRMYSILVPRDQAQRAFAILETNHLVTEKKVLLSRPTKEDEITR